MVLQKVGKKVASLQPSLEKDVWPLGRLGGIPLPCLLEGLMAQSPTDDRLIGPRFAGRRSDPSMPWAEESLRTM